MEKINSHLNGKAENISGIFQRVSILHLALSIIMVFSSLQCASAASRTALVIGNSSYGSVPLDNPVNDARDMASILKRLGFDVILKTNADKKTMKSALRNFKKKLNTAEIGLFYFAGHGMQIQGINYLIPVSNNIKEEWEVESEAIGVGRFLAAMEAAGNPMNIIVLDACRDNPFKRSFRSAVQGLAKMDAPPGTVIAYATAPGSVAADGTGRNGTYTAALLKNMGSPGLDVQKMFNQTGLDVMKETRKEQVPWFSSSPFPEFYLAGGSTTVISPSRADSSTGMLKVDSTPSGADIFMDGRSMGPTPLELKNIAPGSHVIKAKLSSHADESKTIRINPGRKAVVNFYLDPIASYARLYVTTSPPDCRIRILNIAPAFTNGIELDIGRYQLEVSKKGYETKTQWVTIDSAQALDLYVELEKQAVSSGSGRPGKTWTEPVTGMEFVWVPQGCFPMGSNSGGSDEKPVHEVCLDGFWIGKYEVTQRQWKQMMNSNPSQFKGDDLPVETVSWNDAKKFISRLSWRTDIEFALPSEAQWEYAARSGGKNEKYAGGNDVDRFAWYGFNSGSRTHEVGTKTSNGLGIHDMSGNVWEWCEDVYDENAYARHSRNNPVVSSGGSYRVDRGGSWYGKPGVVRCAYRNGNSASFSHRFLGFRLIRKN